MKVVLEPILVQASNPKLINEVIFSNPNSQGKTKGQMENNDYPIMWLKIQVVRVDGDNLDLPIAIR
jgi:hypothetical protein